MTAKPAGKNSKILIVKPSSLGDIIHSLPLLSSVRKCYPDSEIHWIIASSYSNILEGHPMIDRLWRINKDQWKFISKAKKTATEIVELFSNLRKESFDLVIDLQGLLRSGLISFATGAEMRVGFSEAREGSAVFYTDKVKGGKDIHAVERYMKIASFLGCDSSSIEFPMVTEKYQLEISDYIVLVPGAQWITKRWAPENFGKIASLMPIKSLVIGSSKENDIAETVVNNSGGNAVSLAGKTSLKELSWIISRAHFMVCNDSGPMHIAAALGVPVFAIFGPTNPVRTGPYGNMHNVIREDLECSPCYKRKSCGKLKCMESITPEMVFRIIRDSQKDLFK